MPRHKHRQTKRRSDNCPLEAVKLATAKARLAKLEADLPKKPLEEYTRYEDLPPLHPDDAEILKQDLIKQLTWDDDRRAKQKHDWYMSMAHWAP